MDSLHQEYDLQLALLILCVYIKTWPGLRTLTQFKTFTTGPVSHICCLPPGRSVHCTMGIVGGSGGHSFLEAKIRSFMEVLGLYGQI